jgi:hypothetical protein
VSCSVFAGIVLELPVESTDPYEDLKQLPGFRDTARFYKALRQLY